MIFYFSATGNCKYAAQRIAAAIGETTISIPECVKQQRYHFSSDNGTVGIITPTYAWGLPSIVRDFLNELVLDEHPSYPACTIARSSPFNTKTERKSTGNIQIRT